MGSISSSNTLAELPQPFYKINGLKELRGPNENNKFIVETNDEIPNNPIKFRYKTENDDDWAWEWTAHSDQHEWYPVKTTHYTIATDELNKSPYNQIVDKNTTRPLQLAPIKQNKNKPKAQRSIFEEDTKEDDNDNDNDEQEEPDQDDDEKDDFDYTRDLSMYSDKSYVEVQLPPFYENIRKILAEKDPIPPHMLKKHGLATDAYEQVSLTPLAHSKSLQCRFAHKDLGSGGGCRKHPVLLFYEKGKEPEQDWDMVWMLHLMQDSSIMKVVVEFDPKLWKKFKPHKGWRVSNETFDLSGISLLDVAKWGVQYETQNPEYSELVNNCRKFMLKLSQYLRIKWDEVMMAEQVWYTVTDTPQKVSGISDKSKLQD